MSHGSKYILEEIKMKYKFFGTLSILTGFGLALADAHFLYTYYSQQNDSGNIVVPIVGFLSLVPIIFGIKLFSKGKNVTR
jgi:hypothetical protein